MTGEIVSTAPATGEEVWRGLSGDVDDLVERARRGWSSWAAQSLTNRIELVRRTANELRKEADSLATLVAQESGQPLWAARGEVDRVLERVELAVRAYAERTAQRRLDNALQGTSALRHKPHGVVAVLGPVSSPLAVPAAQVIPALIAGNAVILKPSEKMTAAAEVLVQCFHRAGISASVMQLCPGGPETGEALALHEGVDAVLFTGSTHNGIALGRKLAATPNKLVALAMGSNNPIIAWDTPKLVDAAALIVQSAFSWAGQSCTNARRLIVRDTLFDDLMTEVKRMADRLIVGAPFDDPAPFMGPVVDNAAAEGLTESFVHLLSYGGRPIKHMVRPVPGRPFLSPAIIETTGMAERPDIELLGPLLQVVRVATLDEAITEANATQYGLVSALIGGSPQDYNRFWANVRTGHVNWNRPTTAVASSAPFGGTGLSGNHRPGGFYAADFCAYPVASAEMEQPRLTIGLGLTET